MQGFRRSFPARDIGVGTVGGPNLVTFVSRRLAASGSMWQCGSSDLQLLKREATTAWQMHIAAFETSAVRRDRTAAESRDARQASLKPLY